MRSNNNPAAFVRGRYVRSGVAVLAILLVIGWAGSLPLASRAADQATPALTPTPIASATPTANSSATNVAGTATALSYTATALAATATAQAAQGTVISIGATQTALAATITALASTPPPTRTPAATATPTATPIPCLDAYEPDGEPAAARPLVVGERQAHLFCPAGDADWATFFAKAGKAYRIETSNLSVGVDTYLYLFAPGGQPMLDQNDDAPGAHGPSLLTFVPITDGWYLVQVKDQGDIGSPGLGYTLGLSLADTPSATPVAPSATTAPATATLPLPTDTPPLPTSTPLPPTPTATISGTPTPDRLLRPQNGDAGTGGLPLFDGGPLDGLEPDALEPNDRFETAHPVNVGAVYTHLNFVPLVSAGTDADFYSFQTKPGNCYRLTTGDLAAGLDTTIRLWQTAPTREGRRLLAQNDDQHAHSADLSSAVRWCNMLTGADNLWLVAEIRNYGLAPATDPRGKTYSLVIEIAPPSPTPTPPAPTSTPPLPLAPAPLSEGGQGPGFVPPAISPLPSTLPPTARPSPTVQVAIGPSPVSTSPTATAIPTITPSLVQVDVVAYVVAMSTNDPTGSGVDGPQPGDGIRGLAVLLIDAPTNAVIQSALTDGNGHAALRWAWTGPIRVALPAFHWSRAVSREDLSRAGGTLYLEARTPSYALPGILP